MAFMAPNYRGLLSLSVHVWLLLGNHSVFSSVLCRLCLDIPTIKDSTSDSYEYIVPGLQVVTVLLFMCTWYSCLNFNFYFVD